MDIVKLTAVEQNILSAMYLHANMSVDEVAKTIGVRPHVVNYSISKLKDLEVIKKQPFINTYAFGYSQCEIYFSVSSGQKTKIQKLENYLISSERIPWIGTYGGIYQYGLTFCVKDLDDVLVSTGKIFEGHESLVRDSVFAIRKSYTEYSLKNLGKKPRSIKKLEFGRTEKKFEIDELDHKILRFLSEFPESSTRVLAEKLGLASSSMYLRLEALKKKNILLGTSYVINFKKLGFLTYLYMIKLNTLSPKIISEIEEFAENHDDVIYLVKSYGAWDLKIAVNVKDPSKSVSILQEIYQYFGNSIVSTQTLSAFEYIKVNRYPFKSLDFPRVSY